MAMFFEESGSDNIEISNFSPPIDFSVCCWVNLESLKAQRLCGIYDGFEARLWVSGGELLPYNDYYKVGSSATPSATMTIQEWHHLVFTANRTTGIARTYLDGNLINDDTGHTSIVLGSTLSIARRTGNENDTIHGKMEDVRIYDREILQAEAETMYACQGKDNIIHGLFAWWPLIGVTGDIPLGQGVIKDISNNSYDGDVEGSGNNGYYVEGISSKRRLA